MDSLVRNITVIPYSDAWRQVWNNIVDSSRNGTFMHRREYVEYHRNRFTDCSLLALRTDKPVAVLPANRVGSTLFSHQGLTFGGWISLAKEVDMLSMLDIFDATASFARANDICRIVYKPVPHIYCRYPAEEDLYALFRCNARLIASNVSTAIPLSSPLAFNQNARRGVKKALDEGISVTETNDFAPFWQLLSELLTERYNTLPVHSLDEIRLLKSLFPSNIRLFTASINDEPIAGVVIYDSGTVAHAQYIAANARGKQLHALPLVFSHLISNVFASRHYFDFGTSNENNGTYLNEGLVRQKTGMGGRAVVYNTYEFSI